MLTAIGIYVGLWAMMAAVAAFGAFSLVNLITGLCWCGING